MSDEPVTVLVQELFDLALARGDAAQSASRIIPNPFVVRQGAYAIRVDYSAGSSKELSLQAAYDAVTGTNPALVAGDARAYRGVRPLAAPRPLAIDLCREDTGHVAAKAKGLNVEWQSGDPAFDHVVYVDTPTTDPAILAGVLGPEVRRAVIDLLALGFRTIGIDEDSDGTVRAHLNEFSSLNPRPHRGAQALDAFARLLANLPPLVSSGRMVRRTPPLLGLTITLGIVGIAGWFSSVFFVEGLIMATKAAFDLSERAASLAWWEIGGAIALGVVAGIAGGFVYGRIMAAVAKGTSSAHQEVQWAQIAAFGATSVVAFAAAVIAVLLSHPR